MQKPIDFLSEQLHGITPLGVNSSLVDTVKVSAYGQKTPIGHLASSSGDGSRITIAPYDPSLRNVIAKACQDAGFDAYVFSKETVVVNLPIMSGETKIETRNRIKKLGEEAKVAVRNMRKHIKKQIQKETKHEDEKLIQSVTDEAVALIDQIVETKTSYVK